MASLQTKLCMLFDLVQVFMTSIQARNGLIDYADYCEMRLKRQLWPIVYRLTNILEIQSSTSEKSDFWLMYQHFYQLWTQFFANYQQRWTVCIISDDDDQWKLLYVDLKQLFQSAHYLSHKMPDN